MTRKEPNMTQSLQDAARTAYYERCQAEQQERERWAMYQCDIIRDLIAQKLGDCWETYPVPGQALRKSIDPNGPYTILFSEWDRRLFAKVEGDDVDAREVNTLADLGKIIDESFGA